MYAVTGSIDGAELGVSIAATRRVEWPTPFLALSLLVCKHTRNYVAPALESGGGGILATLS